VYAAEWYAANRERLKVSMAANYAANKEERRAKSLDYRAKTKEQKAAAAARYRAANKEKIAADQAAYRTANAEKLKSDKAEWYRKNKARLNAKSRERYAACIEQVRAYNAANASHIRAAAARWREKNKDRGRVYTQNRRERIRKGGDRLSPGLAQRLLKLQRGKCACCKLPLGDDYHLDHIVPLVRGGENVDSNIQLLRNLCNRQKHAKDPIAFMQERGFLL
jgi:5-methylcytosine-specific restriction endonuclease McrA